MEPDDDRAEWLNEFLAIKSTLGSSYEAGQSDPEAWRQYQADKARLFELRRIFEPVRAAHQPAPILKKATPC